MTELLRKGARRPGGHVAAARITRSRYDRAAPVYDIVEAPLERVRYRRWRALVWDRVRGRRVLEVGVGTGRNFPFHPPGCEVIGLDLSRRMLRRAEARVGMSPARVRLNIMDAQDLSFRSGVFDGAVATFVFCSVPDPVRGLKEVRRTLAPGGRLVLLEHVRSSRPGLGRIMDLVNPLMVRITGANINRDTVSNVTRAGFRVTRVTELDSVGIFRLIEAETPAG